MTQEAKYISYRPLFDKNAFLESFNRPQKQYNFQSQNNFNINAINSSGDIELSNFNFGNNNKTISLNLSNIENNNSDGNFLADGQTVNNLFENNVPSMTSKLFHLEMENEEDLCKNFYYMTKYDSYKYYFIFLDDDDKFHLQIKYSFGKTLYPNQMGHFNSLKAIRDYDFIEDLLINSKLLDMKIKIPDKNLHLKFGRKGGEKYDDINVKIKQYCREKMFDL